MTLNQLRNAKLTDATADDNFKLLCSYLRCEVGDDDAMILQCFRSAYDFCINAVGEVDESNATAIMLLYAATQNFYDNRTLSQPDSLVSKQMEYTFKSIILQLQMAKALKDDEVTT